jgi:shingomyelin synthase
MGQTEELGMMSRPNRFTYTPITRGHKPTASQESNTLSTMSEVSCTTTVSMDSSDAGERQGVEQRLEDFAEEGGGGNMWRSGSQETVDTVVTAVHKASELRLKPDISATGLHSPQVGKEITDGRGPMGTPLLTSQGDVGLQKDSVKLDMPRVPEEQAESNALLGKIPSEPLKTLLSALFLGSGFVATTTSLAITHESVPDVAPLPDKILDLFDYQEWGLDVSEYLLMFTTITAIIVVMLHSHRLIILRRIWFMLGILYYFRALTMFVTVLPKSNKDYTCLEKQPNATFTDYTKRVLTLISGAGLSINGKHLYCGDYIFSGHTVTLTMGYLAIKEYSPRRFLLLHWASFFTSVGGVIFLLLARGHYSIDVVVAYYVTTRLWWIYHTLAHNQQLKAKGNHNMLDNICWWHVFRFFEARITGPIPRRYSLPLPKMLKRWFMKRFCRGVSSGDHQSVSNEDLTK